MPDIIRTPLRLPRDLHQRVRAAADREHRSLNAQLITLVERALSQEESK
jgi:hypothetical protein